MRLKHISIKLRRKLKPRGMIITGPIIQDGKLLAHVRIAKWYIPVLMLKGLKQSSIPRRYWPLLYWQYYVERRWKGAS